MGELITSLTPIITFITTETPVVVNLIVDNPYLLMGTAVGLLFSVVELVHAVKR